VKRGIANEVSCYEVLIHVWNCRSSWPGFSQSLFRFCPCFASWPDVMLTTAQGQQGWFKKTKPTFGKGLKPEELGFSPSAQEYARNDLSHPELGGLPYELSVAERTMRIVTWSPMTKGSAGSGRQADS
jgi:hypothetical protein